MHANTSIEQQWVAHPSALYNERTRKSPDPSPNAVLIVPEIQCQSRANHTEIPYGPLVKSKQYNILATRPPSSPPTPPRVKHTTHLRVSGRKHIILVSPFELPHLPPEPRITRAVRGHAHPLQIPL